MAAPDADTALPKTELDGPDGNTAGPQRPDSPHRARIGTSRKWLWRTALLLALIAALFGGNRYWLYLERYPSTDDAYVSAHVVRIAPQVPGRVALLPAYENEHVKEGQLLVEIDPAPFQLALEQAEANLDLAKQEAAATEAAIEAAHADVAQREAALRNVQANTRRTLVLVGKGTLPKAQGDDARAALKEAQAALAAARADLRRASKQLGAPGARNAQVRVAAADVAKARLDLSYTKIIAPASGILGKINIRPGAMVATGQALFPLVEDDGRWVEGNYKETDLQRIAPGQPASVTLDIYPNRTFHGVVESLSPASGVAFSLLPPENATGNWVKVTQRFPVRVRITDQDAEHPLRIGASAQVTIDTIGNHGSAGKRHVN